MYWVIYPRMSWSAKDINGYDLRVHRHRGRWVADIVDPDTGTRLKRLRIILDRVTFSIETDKGKEPPAVEITVCTNLPAASKRETERMERRIVNAVVKLLWVMFDIRKDTFRLTTEQENEVASIVPFAYGRMDLWPSAKWVKRRRKGKEIDTLYLGVISERRLDRAIWRVDHYLRQLVPPRRAMDRVGERGEKEGKYFTSEHVIKIGVEYGEPDRKCPRWPYVYVRIDMKAYQGKGKGKRGKGEVVRERHWELYLYIRDRLRYDVLKRLGVEVRWEE